MYKYLSILFFVLCTGTVFGQVDSSKLKIDSTKTIVKKELLDSAVSKVDTVAKKETRAERKAREHAQKEREKYFYKDILKDSARLEIEHLSRVAWKRSAILPGWGQVTNGGKFVWLKLPVIYGGFVAAYLTFDFWNWHYQKFVKEAAHRIDTGEPKDPDLVNYTNLEGLIRSKDNYRRYRDMTILVTAVWWTANVVEAYTDSMLRFRYNIGDDLGFKITPTLLPATAMAYQPNIASQFTPGVKLTLSLK